MHPGTEAHIGSNASGHPQGEAKQSNSEVNSEVKQQ